MPPSPEQERRRDRRSQMVQSQTAAAARSNQNPYRPPMRASQVAKSRAANNQPMSRQVVTKEVDSRTGQLKAGAVGAPAGAPPAAGATVAKANKYKSSAKSGRVSQAETTPLLKKTYETTTQLSKPLKFYLNFVVLNKDELVESKVEEKVGGGVFGLGITKAIASAAAKKFTDDEKVTDPVLDGLMEKIPQTMQSVGISVRMQKKLALGVEVRDVDPVDMTYAEAPERGPALKAMVEAMIKLELKDGLEALWLKMMEKAKHGLMAKFQMMLPENLKKTNNVDLAVMCFEEEPQSEFFCTWLGLTSGEERLAYAREMKQKQITERERKK